MNSFQRFRALMSAAPLAVLLAAAHYRGGLGARPALLVPPPLPAVADFTVETKGSFIAAAKMPVKPAKPPKIRGAALRYKGEALIGRAPYRIGKSTETLAAR